MPSSSTVKIRNLPIYVFIYNLEVFLIDKKGWRHGPIYIYQDEIKSLVDVVIKYQLDEIINE